MLTHPTTFSYGTRRAQCAAGIAVFSEKVISGAGIAGQFPARPKSSLRPRSGARIAERPLSGAEENRPFLQDDYTLLQLPAKPPKKLYNRIV